MSTLISKSFSKDKPIWLMRQAGRYLKEYKKIRKKKLDFIDFCLDVKLATEVTLQPIKKFDFDAAIIFSDILVIPYALGQKIKFEENTGPVLNNLDFEKAKLINEIQFKKKTKNVYRAIKLTRSKLNKKKSLIGFVGSPWTLLVYMLNQESPKKKKFNLKKNKKTYQLLKLLEKFIIIHIEQQIKSGVDVIQLFDSWSGLLKNKDLKQFCFKPNQRIIKKIKKKFPKIPVICFPKDIGKNIIDFCKIVKPDCINIDSKINPDFINKNISNKIIIQGGLDPKYLLGKEKIMKKKALYYLKKFKNRPYIFNLGHGVDKKTKPSNVYTLIKTVRKFA